MFYIIIHSLRAGFGTACPCTIIRGSLRLLHCVPLLQHCLRLNLLRLFLCEHLQIFPLCRAIRSVREQRPGMISRHPPLILVTLLCKFQHLFRFLLENREEFLFHGFRYWIVAVCDCCISISSERVHAVLVAPFPHVLRGFLGPAAFMLNELCSIEEFETLTL